MNTGFLLGFMAMSMLFLTGGFAFLVWLIYGIGYFSLAIWFIAVSFPCGVLVTYLWNGSDSDHPKKQEKLRKKSQISVNEEMEEKQGEE